MKKGKVINKYVLSYTRDRQIITQLGWFYGNSQGIGKLLNKDFGNTIPMIFYYNNGPIEIWDNVKAISNIQKEIVKKNREDKNFCNEVITIFDKIKKDFFEGKWRNKFTKDLKELKEVSQKFREMCPYYVFIYYSLLTESIDKNVKEEIKKWKERDVFFEKTGKYVEKSLENIYPKIKALVNYIKLEEIDSPPTKAVLKKRKKNYVIVPGFFDETINIENFAKKHKEILFLGENIKQTNLLKGNGVSRGRVVGRVRLLRSRDNMGNVLPGEIIVSPMTTPEFLPAMKRASAFITDEGGLLSHAAIVARELNKPCIVGTKFATKILKDGDLVEVNADKGIVKILKEAK